MQVKKGKTLQVGKHLVKVKDMIGSGGFADVFLVKDSSNGANLALKVVKAQDPSAIRAVYSEFSLMASLKEPFFVSFVDSSYQTAAGGGFVGMLLMEYCSGGRVVDLLNQFAPTGHPLPLPLLMKIFSSVLNALVYLHTQSPPIAHRDIKTANVLIQFLPGHNHVGENGEGAVFKLCDFGSCTTKVLPAELSQKQRQDAEDDIQKYTTLDYRAPEQVNLFSKCPVDTKVDIWGLGCFLYQTLFFKDAFGDKMNIMSGQYPLPPTPAIPDSILALLGTLLTVDARARPTAQGVVSYLQKTDLVKPGMLVSATPTASDSKPSQPQPQAISRRPLPQPPQEPERPSLSSASPSIPRASSSSSSVSSSSSTSSPLRKLPSSVSMDSFQENQVDIERTLVSEVAEFAPGLPLEKVAFLAEGTVCLILPAEVMVLKRDENSPRFYSIRLQQKIQVATASFHSTKPIISLNVQNMVQAFNVEEKLKLGTGALPDVVNFWRWLDSRRMVIASGPSIFIWTMALPNGELTNSEPQKVLDLLEPLAISAIDVAFSASDLPLWVMVSGKSQNRLGKTQLYSVEKQGNQLLESSLALLAPLPDTNSLLACVVLRVGNDHILNIIPLQKGSAPSLAAKKILCPALPPGGEYTCFSFLEQSSLVALLSSTGEIMVVNIRTGSRIFQGLPTGPGFDRRASVLKVVPAADGSGWLVMNDSLQVSRLRISEPNPDAMQNLAEKLQATEMAPLKKEPSNPFLAGFAGNFANEFSSPAPEITTNPFNPFNPSPMSPPANEVEELTFPESLELGDFEKAAILALQDPSLRGKKAIDAVNAVSFDSSEYPPILQYFEALTELAVLTAEESLCYLQQVLAHESDGSVQHFAAALHRDRLTPDQELGSLMLNKPGTLTDCAAEVFEKLGAIELVIQALEKSGQFHRLLAYLRDLPPSAQRERALFQESLFLSLLNYDPNLASEYALITAGPLPEGSRPLELLELVTRCFQERGLLLNLTAYLLEALKGDLMEHAHLQTRLIELNLNLASPVGLQILEQRTFSHFDKGKIAAICLTLGFFQQALELYILLSDWVSIEKCIISYSPFIEPEFVTSCCLSLLASKGSEGFIATLASILEMRSPFHSEVFFRIVTALKSYLDTSAVVKLVEASDQEELLFRLLVDLGPAFNTTKAHYAKLITLGLRLSAVAPLYGYFRPLLLDQSGDLATRVDAALLKDLLVITCFEGQEAPYSVVGQEEQFQVLFWVANQHGFQEELITRLLTSGKLLSAYLQTLSQPEIALKLFLFLGSLDLANSFLALFRDSPKAAEFLGLVEEYKSRTELVGQLQLRGKPLLDHYLSSGDLRQVVLFLAREQDPGLWEEAINLNEQVLQLILRDTVLLLLFTPAEYSVLLKFLMKTENQNLEQLITLLHRVLIGIANHPFRLHPSLQTLLLSSTLKSSKPERTLDYLKSLSRFDVKEICQTAIRLGRFEEALQIAKGAKDYELAAVVLVNHIGDMARAFDFANSVDDPGVWRFVGQAQWRKQTKNK